MDLWLALLIPVRVKPVPSLCKLTKLAVEYTVAPAKASVFQQNSYA